MVEFFVDDVPRDTGTANSVTIERIRIRDFAATTDEKANVGIVGSSITRAAATPEPATLILVGSGFVGLRCAKRRRRVLLPT